MQILRKIASTSHKIFRSVAGFTLVELLVVITIIGITTAVAIPNFLASSRRSTFQAMVNEVSTLFEQARTQALASEFSQSGSNLKTPPGGYGIFLNLVSQKATLFVDDFHAGCSLASCFVNMNYANEDMANRVSPDGIYTAGSDTVVKSVAINSKTYMKLLQLSGKKEDDTNWTSSNTASVTVIFTPPYAEASIVAIDGGSSIPLKEFEAKFDLSTENAYRKIKFNRITTTPQIFQGNNAEI
ncbi:MAG: prepilin-type N-terminal cleavage/methylation domain-containing protein [Candidatus Gracilibacteria bacterium]